MIKSWLQPLFIQVSLHVCYFIQLDLLSGLGGEHEKASELWPAAGN